MKKTPRNLKRLKRPGRPRKDHRAPATYICLDEDLDTWVRRQAASPERPVTINEQINLLIREAKRRQEGAP